MSKKIQKKKTTTHFVLETLIKILLVIVFIILAFISYHKITISGGFDFSSTKERKEASVPSELKWFDDFKGIENVPDGKSKKSEKSKNFLQYESSKNKK